MSDNIFTALAAVYKEIGYVQKKGKNKQQDYKYAGEAQFIEEIRPHLIEHGVIFWPISVNVIADSSILSDKRQNRIVGTYTFRFHHVPSGTYLDAQAIGEGVDPTDKSAYKAATGALKYALRQTLLIETGDDPEKDEPDTRNSPTQGTKTPQEHYGKGGARQFRQEWVEVQQAIQRAGEPEHFSWVQSKIEEIKEIDPQCADQLQRELDDREAYIMAIK